MGHSLAKVCCPGFEDALSAAVRSALTQGAGVGDRVVRGSNNMSSHFQTIVQPLVCFFGWPVTGR